jgi:hypothetical protein
MKRTTATSATPIAAITIGARPGATAVTGQRA